ncbi:CLUMA_CG008618, isoform A [Clunio marinus]|uniref:CLUMA_CG008618, isoform A n=1 Tax=Clunio marinus TaxID=568069 RepID=A0A1J1I6D8_9DIPT|nr:CLUMA_CG008618, isoform A [Clunio marinus]
MKLLTSIILSVLMLQALAKPTFDEQNESEVRPVNEVVDAFRAQIDVQFVRYTNFYDRANAAMRDYRMAHVALITDIYNRIMAVFGETIEALNASETEMEGLIQKKIEMRGDTTPCIQNVINHRESVLKFTSENIQQCAIFANQTLATMLTDVFYPIFTEIQTVLSTVPLSVVEVLSLGNVLQDEEAIVQYLVDRYDVIQLQWLAQVSQLLRWDTNRFENDGLFLVDDTRVCLTEDFMPYIVENSRLEKIIQEC